MASDGEDQDSLPIYESHPPGWLARSHATADLGYIGFHPPRPDQEEEILTESNVKTGFVLGFSVPAETFSAQDTVRTSLVSENAIVELEELMNHIFARRSAELPPVPASSFKLPSRVTLNDAKREAWFTDLANPEVPLYKLGKSVPHGAKGHDLLDLLHRKNVAIPRAVWFLRVFGANETAGLRNKPMYNPTQYSVDWANVVTSYMKKQLTDIALPGAPRVGLNIKQTFKGVLSDSDAREQWVSRFTYCLNLLRSFYSEGLVDNRTFLAWLAQQMSTCNLAQLGFVARLADEYLDGMLISRALTRPFVNACLHKLSEIRIASTQEHLANSESILKNLVMRAFLALPDAFVSPRAWITHFTLLRQVLSEHLETGPLADNGENNVLALRQTFYDNWADVRTRNDAMLYRKLPARVKGSLSSALQDIKLLNSLPGRSDMESVPFFDNISEGSDAFTRKLDILLTWSVTPLQYGDHRPYAAACLLRCWRDKTEERARRRDRASPDEFVQDQLFDWLDSCEVAAEASNLPYVALLYGQLVKQGLFSYAAYIQRLIARGEMGLCFAQEPGSRHRNFLRWIPIHSSSSSLVSQRKVTLYGVRVRETPEDTNERQLRKEIRSVLPQLFGGTSPETVHIMTTNDLELKCQSLLSAPRFEQVRTIKEWLLPLLRKNISSQEQGSFGNDYAALRVYCISTVLMAHCKCYGSILELTLFALEHTSTYELLTAAIETLRQHMEIWASLSVVKKVTTTLYGAHQTWRTRGIQGRGLLNLLIDIDAGQYLEPAAREQIFADKAAYTNALHPLSEHLDGVPAALPEILLLATNPDPEAPSILANSLWYKYCTAPQWGWKVWDNTIASLRQIPSMISDLAGRRACALRYATFLIHVDQHLPGGFDGQILDWFLGSGKHEVAALTPDAWDVVIVVLLHLAIHGALATTTILKGLIYPAWRSAAAATFALPLQGSSMEVVLNATNDLCGHLLLSNECGTGIPPMNCYEAQGLRARRRDVYREPHFGSLMESIPILVLLEWNKNLTSDLRQASSALRESICSLRVFRQGVYRDLETVHRAFERFLSSEDTSDELHGPLISALRLMLNEGPQDQPSDAAGWQRLSSFLSPWKLAATSIEIRFTLRQLGDALGHALTRVGAMAQLEQLTTAVFNQGMTPEEADFVAEMMREASGDVVHQFVNAGLRRITEILNDPLSPPSTEQLTQLVAKAGEVLRLLMNVTETFREDASTLPQLEQEVQDELMSALCTKLEKMSDIVSKNTTGDSAEAMIDLNEWQVTQTIVFLARVLQFDLGFLGVWTPHVKSLSEQLCKTLTRLAMAHATGSTLNPSAFHLLLDTLLYVLDDIPIDTKATVLDPFRNYPQFDLQDLATDMPTDCRKRLRSLLPFVSPNSSIDHLAYSSKDASGQTSLAPVQNRPWEWTENIGGENVAIDSKAEANAFEERTAIKNSASLSLDLFGARLTSERILQSASTDVEPRIDANLRTFQDDFYGESIFKRDWRETRVGPDDGFIFWTNRTKPEPEDDVSTLPSLTQAPGALSKRGASRVASPTSSIRSRGSVQPAASTSTYRQSPLNRLSGSNPGEPIDVDSIDIPTSTSQSASKRTAGTSVVEDDEIQILDVPPPPAKKIKGRATTKPRTKRR